MSGNKDWKEKYYESLQKLDDRQATWDELETLLRKAVSRLAITAKGIDAKLDRVLADIQQHSRKKQDEALTQDLEVLSRVLSTIDDQPAAEAERLETPDSSSIHDHILKLIHQLRLDGDMIEQFETFKASIHAMDDQQCVDGFAELVNSFLEHRPSDKTPVKEVLITLVEKIAFTHGESEHLNSIKQLLDDRFDKQNWHTYLDEIISEVRVIIDGINDEKVELETLIVDVTRQLNEISGVLTEEHTDNVEGRKHARELQSLMDQSVNTIRDTVESAADIESMKNSIHENLDTIKKGVTEFVTQDDDRFHKFEQRNDTLRKHIQVLERESEQLKLKLSEDRKKLMFDTLTGARSRLSYEEVLEQELYRWSRYQDVFSFAILDIDHFKRINDRYGHNAGDKALRIVARLMSKNIRKTDFLFRIGGEEFVLLLPKTELAGATPLVEKLRKSVGATSFHFKQEDVDISLSAGVTAIRPGDTAESIYERADKALYEAKQGGRDRLISKPV